MTKIRAVAIAILLFLTVMEYEAREELNGDIFYYTIQDKKKL